MATLHLNMDRASATMRTKAITKATAVVDVGKTVAADATPVDTGTGEASWHRKVIDDHGMTVVDEPTDGNGNATPDYQGFPGMVVGIVATNEIAETGQAYLHYVNRGVHGRSGVLMKEQARAAMDAERKRR